MPTATRKKSPKPAFAPPFAVRGQSALALRGTRALVGKRELGTEGTYYTGSDQMSPIER